MRSYRSSKVSVLNSTANDVDLDRVGDGRQEACAGLMASRSSVVSKCASAAELQSVGYLVRECRGFGTARQGTGQQRIGHLKLELVMWYNQNNISYV
jgi:hypothetical protein